VTNSSPSLTRIPRSPVRRKGPLAVSVSVRASKARGSLFLGPVPVAWAYAWTRYPNLPDLTAAHATFDSGWVINNPSYGASHSPSNQRPEHSVRRPKPPRCRCARALPPWFVHSTGFIFYNSAGYDQSCFAKPVTGLEEVWREPTGCKGRGQTVCRMSGAGPAQQPLYATSNC